MTKQLFFAICVLHRGGGKLASRGAAKPNVSPLVASTVHPKHKSFRKMETDNFFRTHSYLYLKVTPRWVKFHLFNTNSVLRVIR